MFVVVIVMIVRQLFGGLWTKKTGIFGMLRHGFGLPRAAHMAIEAQHAIAARHDDMQIVRDKEHAEFALVAKIAN